VSNWVFASNTRLTVDGPSLDLKQAYAVWVVCVRFWRVSWRMVNGPNLVGWLVVVRIVGVAGV
jgi:hypothetical protein